jgi:hypothetical protein
LRFLRIGARPIPQPCWGITGERARPAWRLAFRIEVHMKPLVPRQGRLQDSGPTKQLPHKTKAMRALHRMAFAGTVPLLAKIPSPVT